MIDIKQNIYQNDGKILFKLWKEGYSITQQNELRIILVKYNTFYDYLHVVIVNI